MKPKPKPKGATRGQIALVAILGVILAAVLGRNFMGAGEPDVAAAADEAEPAVPGTTPAAAGAATTAASSGPFGEFAVDQNWQRPSVEEVAKFDPLADGEPDAPVMPEYNAEELTELRNAQDAIIFESEGQTVARIGTKEFHVGDLVGGLEVREISSAGIVLSEPK